MDTLQVIAAVKGCSEAQLRDLEQATGVPHPTLAKIKYGVTTDPRSSTVDALRRHFERQARESA
jgi:predicted transcriptional regulator